MDRLWTVMRKEFYHIWRDPITLFLIVLLPASLLVLLGYGVSGDVKDIPMAVADLSKTDASRRYIEYFTTSGYFVEKYDVLSEDEILGLIDKGSVDIGIYIPEDFGRSLQNGVQTSVQFYNNGSDPSIAQTTQLTLEAISQMAIQNIFTNQLSQAMGGRSLELPIKTYLQTLYNPNMKTINFMIPGLIAILMQIQAILLTSLAIVREREQGTMEQLIVTPVKSWELMLGKILPYLLFGFLNIVMVLVVGIFLFGVPVAGSVWLLMGLSLMYILGSLGLGVLISNLSRTQMQAMFISVGAIVMPAVILSGLIFPRTDMPWLIYWIGELLPVTHYLEIIRGIMLKGIGFDFLLPSFWGLLVLSVVYFTASVLAFRKRI
jgi:ABC-2 type transport system permease protein